MGGGAAAQLEGKLGDGALASLLLHEDRPVEPRMPAVELRSHAPPPALVHSIAAASTATTPRTIFLIYRRLALKTMIV